MHQDDDQLSRTGNQHAFFRARLAQQGLQGQSPHLNAKTGLKISVCIKLKCPSV